ncbi:hypothetical protein ACB092_11G080400 [Castanea dentata]
MALSLAVALCSLQTQTLSDDPLSRSPMTLSPMTFSLADDPLSLIVIPTRHRCSDDPLQTDILAYVDDPLS